MFGKKSHRFLAPPTDYASGTPGIPLPERPGWLLPLALVGAIFILQVLLGCDWRVLMSGTAAVLAGFWALQLGGLRDGGAVFCFAFAANSLLWGMCAKTVFGQPLDSFLALPLKSFLIYLLVIIEVVAAYLIVRRIPLGRPLFRAVQDPQMLSFLASSSYALGVLFWAANRGMLVDLRYRYLTPAESFGGFALLKKVFYLSVICATARCVVRSRGKKSFDWFVGLAMVTGVMMGVIDNNKVVMATSVVAYVLTLIYFRGTIKKKEGVGVLLLVLTFVFIIAPVIQLYRKAGIRKMGLSERINFVISHREEVMSWESLSSFFGPEIGETRRPWDYFGYNVFMLDRFVTVQRLAPVIEGMSNHAEMGSKVLTPAFRNVPPSFIYSNKPVVPTPDLITWELSLRRTYVVGYPVVPLPAHAYAAWKLIGVIFIPFAVFLALLCIMKKLGWRLWRNVFALWFFMFVFAHGAEWSFDGYISYMCRSLPVWGMMAFGLVIAGRFFLGKREGGGWLPGDRQNSTGDTGSAPSRTTGT